MRRCRRPALALTDDSSTLLFQSFFFSVLMLQVSLNNGKTFVSSNVNISAKNCTSGVVENRTKTENGTKTHKQEEKPRVCLLPLFDDFLYSHHLSAYTNVLIL